VSSGTRCRRPSLARHGDARKEPAPSVRRKRDVNADIAGEICAALERLGADAELLAIVGSWHDTPPDADVLRMLRECHAGRQTLRRSQ
jgi:hypothetical protein